MIGGDERVEGIDSALGHRRRVRSRTVVGHVDFGERSARHAHQIDTRRMHHQRGVDTFERARACHQFLAATAFFGRRAENAHAPGQVISKCRQREAGTERRRRDQIVSAGVSDARERVVLGEYRDAGTGLAPEFGDECGLEPEGASLDLEFCTAERLDQQLCRVGLLECEFRLGVDRVGNPQQLGFEAVDGFAGSAFQEIERVVGHARSVSRTLG